MRDFQQLALFSDLTAALGTRALTSLPTCREHGGFSESSISFWVYRPEPCYYHGTSGVTATFNIVYSPHNLGRGMEHLKGIVFGQCFIRVLPCSSFIITHKVRSALLMIGWVVFLFGGKSH